MLKKKLITLHFLISFLFYVTPQEAISTNIPASKLIETSHTSTNHSTLDAILKRGVLRVAMHAEDFPPFFMVSDEGKLIGIDVELAKGIAQQLGVKIIFNREPITYDDVVKHVANGLSDIAVSGLSLTLKRAFIVRYTDPYISLNKAMVINRLKLLEVGGNTSVHNIFSKRGSEIATILGSSYETFAKRIFPKATIYSEKLNSDIVTKLIKGEVWAAFKDELGARRMIFLYKNASLYLLAVNLKDEQDPIMMVVNKGAPFFQEWLNLYLRYIYKKQSVKESVDRFEKYFYRK